MTSSLVFYSAQILLVILSAACISWTAARGKTIKVKDFVSPPKGIENLSFGMRPQLADLIWIRSLQDFEFCEKSQFKFQCEGKDWLFRMLKAVVTLDPKYKNAYSAGGLALTVLVSDYEGATEIFDMGLKEFPNDWPLNFRAAYHYLFEVGDFERAAVLYSRATELGGPFWGESLGKRLATKAGRLEVGKKVLAVMSRDGMPPAMAERMAEKLKKIEESPD